MKICRYFFFIMDESKRLRCLMNSLSLFLSLSLSLSLSCVPRRGQQRRLNYVPDANIVDCSVPLASFIHLSASLKIPLMRYGICIRSHFEYDVLSSQARSAHSSLFLPLSFSLFSRLVESRFHVFSFFTSQCRCSLIASLESIDDRISISDRREFTHSSQYNSMRIHDFSANKRVRIVSIDWFLITS